MRPRTNLALDSQCLPVCNVVIFRDCSLSGEKSGMYNYFTYIAFGVGRLTSSVRAKCLFVKSDSQHRKRRISSMKWQKRELVADVSGRHRGGMTVSEGAEFKCDNAVIMHIWRLISTSPLLPKQNSYSVNASTWRMFLEVSAFPELLC